jgi:electron transport complex protein RnfG
MSDTKKKGYLLQAWLVLVLASGFGGALAGVHLTLKDQIAANKLNETLERIPDLVPGAQVGVKIEMSGWDVYKALDSGGRQIGWVVPASGQDFTKRVEIQIGMDVRVLFRAFDAAGRQVGWVVPASGQGFADRIEILIGLDVRAKTITGLYVLDQKETPGLGNKITTTEFLRQFAGRSAAEALVVVKTASSGNEIQAITGATISSKSVCDIVNKAVEQLGEAP